MAAGSTTPSLCMPGCVPSGLSSSLSCQHICQHAHEKRWRWWHFLGVCVEASTAPLARSGATRVDGSSPRFRASTPRMPSKPRLSSAAPLLPALADDAALARPAGIRPLRALFLPPGGSRRPDVDGSGYGALASCACPPTISSRRGRRVVGRRGSAAGERLAASAPFVHGQQALEVGQVRAGASGRDG